MAEQKIHKQNFSAGITTVGEKVGEKDSALFIKGLNIFESPDYLTLARALTKVSGATVDGLIRWAVDGSPWNDNRYFYDEQGKIYRETSGGTWSTLRTVSGGGGEGLLIHDDALYYAQETNLGRYWPLSGTPAFTDSFDDWWITSDLQQTDGGTGASDYVPPTSISEAATARQSFFAQHDPLVYILINVDVVGTGDWTVTLHDDADNVIGSETIANGSMATGDVTFTFDTPLRVTPGAAYHFHVTSTVADGGVDTGTATDLEDAYFVAEFQPLVSANFHPMVQYDLGFVIGNERYLGVFNGLEYNPTNIVFPAGFEVRTLAIQDEYVVAECWRGQSFAEAEEARRYYWDGIEPTWNYYDDLKIGAPNAIANYKNQLYGIYGNRGSLYRGDKPFEEVTDEIPKLVRGKRVEIYPGAIDTYEERLVFGISGVTDDASGLEQGVYEYGSQTDKIEAALSFPYLISTGTTQGTTLKIGCVKSFGQDLYVAWRDASSYGVDKVTAGDAARASGVYEDRIFDAGDPNKEMQAIKLELTFEALASGQSVTPKYQLDRSGSFTAGDTVSTVGATEAVLFINTVCREVQWGWTLASSGGTFPKLTGVSFIYDDLEGMAESA